MKTRARNIKPKISRSIESKKIKRKIKRKIREKI